MNIASAMGAERLRLANIHCLPPPRCSGPLTIRDEIVQDQARQLCTKLAEALADADEAVYEYEPAKRIEEIESESREGFWAWTGGGYSVTLPAALSHLWSSGCWDPEGPLGCLVESGQRFIEEAWSEQFPDRPALVDCICADDDTPGAAFREEAEEWESEAWSADDDTYFWKARVILYDTASYGYNDAEAPVAGEPYVYVDAYLNTDLNYGRDNIGWLSAYGSSPNQTVGEFKRFLTLGHLADLTDRQMDVMVAEALPSLP